MAQGLPVPAPPGSGSSTGPIPFQLPPSPLPPVFPEPVFSTVPCIITAFGGGGCASEATLLRLGQLQARAAALLADSREIHNTTKRILDERIDRRLQRMLEPVAASEWSAVSEAIGRLVELNRQARSLTFEAQQTAVEAERYFPKYENTAPSEFFKDYKAIADNTRTQVIRALRNSDFAVDDFATLNGTLDRLNRLNGNALGQTQAIQTGNAIALVLADQLARMRIALKAHTDAQTAFAAHQVVQEQRRVKLQENFWRADLQKLRAGPPGFAPK